MSSYQYFPVLIKETVNNKEIIIITFSIGMFIRCIFRDMTYVNSSSFKIITDLIPNIHLGIALTGPWKVDFPFRSISSSL